MRLATTGAQARDEAGPGRPRAAVLTMGALHEGHASLMAHARRLVGAEGSVVVTVFVNPTQFAAGEDFSRYPRTLEADLAVCEAAGVDVVLAPDVVEVYGNPDGFRPDSVTVDPGPLGGILEGAARPGHFRGALTVVHKLLGLTGADVTVFGEKDYQQLVLVRRMCRDLSTGVTVVGSTTQREPDGLALSSRNRYLDAEERRAAGVIPRALEVVAAALPQGTDAALDAGRALLATEPLVDLDYLVVTDPELGPAPEHGPARILLAARVGSTRLIDNAPAVIGA